MTVDPDHVDIQVTRVLIPEDRWGNDEHSLISSFHGLACVASTKTWSSEFKFVCLLDIRSIDYFSVNIDGLSPVSFLEEIVDEVVKFHQGHVLAVTLHLGAYSHRVTPDNDVVTPMESKYVITIPTDGTILVSGMHRELESHVLENDGRWNTTALEYTPLDGDGELKRIARELQDTIRSQREKRETSHA